MRAAQPEDTAESGSLRTWLIDRGGTRSLTVAALFAAWMVRESGIVEEAFYFPDVVGETVVRETFEEDTAVTLPCDAVVQ